MKLFTFTPATFRLATFSLLPLVGVAGTTLAQNNQAQNQPQTEPAQEPAAAPMPDPLDDEAQRLVDMLEGSWRTADPIAEGDDHMIVRLMPFVSPTLGHVMYVESAREGDPWTATRQSLFKVYRFGDQLRLRTLDFRDMSDRKWEHLIGLWAVPEAFPGDSINAEDVIATMDINMDASGGGFSGQTPCPYPTREYSAVEMSSELEVTAGSIVTRDTFYGEDGDVVAGAGVTSDASGIRWEPHESEVEVKRSDEGLVQILLVEAEEGAEEPQEGANVYVHYSGWLTDGTLFDSSLSRGVAYRFVYPGRFIEGWNQAIAEMATGSRRKLVIPPELGYGDQPMRVIPPNSTLIFDVEMLKIDPPEPPDAAQGEGEGAAGGGNDGQGQNQNQAGGGNTPDGG